MNITGRIGNVDETSSGSTGAFYRSGYSGELNNKEGAPDPDVYFDASRSWSGSTSANGQHTHTIGNTGSGLPLNIMPPYKTVYMWRRTA